MSDLIRREDAIEALDFEIVHMTAYCNGKNEGNPMAQYNKGLEDGIKAIRALPSAEPERKWIPVSEALPKNSEHDWVLGQIRETDCGYLWIPKVVEYRESSDDWFEESIGWLKKNPDHAFEVIAWMPLPESYKGD